MKEIFLIAALSLPYNPQADYNALREFLEIKYPKYQIVFINENETLLGKEVEGTPLYTNGLRLWAINKSA